MIDELIKYLWPAIKFILQYIYYNTTMELFSWFSFGYLWQKKQIIRNAPLCARVAIVLQMFKGEIQAFQYESIKQFFGLEVTIYRPLYQYRTIYVHF